MYIVTMYKDEKQGILLDVLNALPLTHSLVKDRYANITKCVTTSHVMGCCLLGT